MKFEAEKLNETEYRITHIRTMKNTQDEDVDVVLGHTVETVEKVEQTIEAMEEELNGMNEKYKEDISGLQQMLEAINKVK